MRSIELYLDDIVMAIDNIHGYLSEVDNYVVFNNDDRLRLIVRMLLVDIGEAASRIPVEVRETYSEVSWTEIIAFRNILVHKYFGLDWEVIWDTVQNDLDTLRKTATRMLEELGEDKK